MIEKINRFKFNQKKKKKKKKWGIFFLSTLNDFSDRTKKDNEGNFLIIEFSKLTKHQQGQQHRDPYRCSSCWLGWQWHPFERQ